MKVQTKYFVVKRGFLIQGQEFVLEKGFLIQNKDFVVKGRFLILWWAIVIKWVNGDKGFNQDLFWTFWFFHRNEFLTYDFE